MSALRTGGRMVTLYKLTDISGQSYGQTQWGPSITHTAPGRGELCTNGWIHAYRSPQLALLLSPIHVGYRSGRLWRADGVVGRDDGLKVGCTQLTTLEELEAPTLPTEQRIVFALWCALAVYDNPAFVSFAEDWLAGDDRTAARAGARAAAEAAARAATARPLPLQAFAAAACLPWEGDAP